MKILAGGLLLICICTSVAAQQQRALVIGVDAYSPSNNKKAVPASGRTEWLNLDGCHNDAAAIKNEIILRWGFGSSSIRELYDSAATRKNILAEINRLLNESKKGDIAFIFYAGHGSQMKNSQSSEQDKLDESIVPADAWKEGVEDIRDKTMATLINKFIDKGILLTTIFDCCHSGSLGRGFNDVPPKFRYIKVSNQDAMDASAPPVPELRQEGLYLSISASQENEPAQEQQDDHNIPHGAFTVALLKAMNQQSVDASVSNLFNATRAILKSNGKKQEPVLAGSSQRLHGTLFGLPAGVLPNKTLIPVIAVSDSTVEFQGGFMAGLNVDNELTKPGGSVRVKITTMMGANRCVGKLAAGRMDSVHPGELFEVSNWVSSSAPFLKLYIPAGTLPYEQIEKIAGVCSQLKQSPALQWTNDPDKHDPDISIYYATGQWMMNGAATGPVRLPALSLNAVGDAAKGRFVSVNIPPPAPLTSALQSTFSSIRSIQLTDNPNDAQYLLSGTLDNNNQLCYRWVRSQALAEDSLEPMPLQTRMFPLRSGIRENVDALRESLYESAARLSKIRAWLNLQAPRTGNQFPFHLEVRNESTGQLLGEQGITVGDKLSVYLKAGENYASRWDRKKRFVYVFLIDRNGNMSLVYPDENSGNLGNHFPVLDDKEQPLAGQKLAEGEVTEPVGTDTYFMLATEEPVPDYAYAFNQQGVRGNPSVNQNNPLNELINLANPAARGFRKPIADNWNLERVAVKTHH